MIYVPKLDLDWFTYESHRDYTEPKSCCRVQNPPASQTLPYQTMTQTLTHSLVNNYQFGKILRTNHLNRGEQTATNLEASLSKLEDTLDQLLASMEGEKAEDSMEVDGQDTGKGQPDQSQGQGQGHSGKDEK